MAKDKDTAAEVVEAPVVSERKAAWEAFLAKVEKQNPTQFAMRKALGEWDVIPTDWVA